MPAATSTVLNSPDTGWLNLSCGIYISPHIYPKELQRVQPIGQLCDGHHMQEVWGYRTLSWRNSEMTFSDRRSLDTPFWFKIWGRLLRRHHYRGWWWELIPKSSVLYLVHLNFPFWVRAEINIKPPFQIRRFILIQSCSPLPIEQSGESFLPI